MDTPFHDHLRCVSCSTTNFGRIGDMVDVCSVSTMELNIMLLLLLLLVLLLARLLLLSLIVIFLNRRLRRLRHRRRHHRRHCIFRYDIVTLRRLNVENDSVSKDQRQILCTNCMYVVVRCLLLVAVVETFIDKIQHINDSSLMC